ncbi:FAD-dependent monooxygenase [Nocardia sp. NBC_01503]|uniref:FAD-dependent monooxygenase n=1 Tax=Nocardia sp. NBC_01503 TaxID=2975997 RepID=UPI002E7BBB22|nr:FAD-dependent monooxygenase [Nocardia sp. NBC_01503]WTL34889.1 FAD-dependent monooxygenase [Nocardia sp. NBC_01503]
MSSRALRVIVAGAGIAGLSTAAALRRKGIQVELLESAPELRASGSGIGVACNATAALRSFGVDPVAAAMGRPMERFVLRTAAGVEIRTVDYRDIAAELGHPVVNMHRRDLLAGLRAAAPDVPIRFGAELKGFDLVAGGVRVTCADGYSTEGDALIGADGIRSAVRAQLTGPEPVTDHGYVCWLATAAFEHERLASGTATHYWGAGRRFGFADLGGGQVYWWGTSNVPGRAADWSGGKDEIRACFAGWAPEIGAIIDRTPAAAIITVPAQDRPFLESWGSGPVTLIGDAAHPMLTSLSQGGSSAIEDACVLAHHLNTGADIATALRDYEHARRARTRALVTGSRDLSRVEQLAHPLAVRLRELAFRHAPDRFIRGRTVEPMRFALPA